MPPGPSSRARMTLTLCPPACMVASMAVMKRSRTVKAHGLMPSTAAATITVGRVILGRYIFMASAGALGCQKPVSAIAPKATTANAERMTMRRNCEVVAMLSFDNDLAVHGWIGFPAAANVTVESVSACLLRRESGIIGTFGLGDNIHTQFIHSPLMLSAAIGVMFVIQAGQADGDRLADLEADLWFVKAAHVSGNVNHIASHGLKRWTGERGLDVIACQSEYADDDHGKDR